MSSAKTTKTLKTTKTFGVSIKLKLEIGFDVEAENFEEALAKVRAMKTGDIVDFEANGWDHNDSDEPVLTGIFQHDA